MLDPALLAINQVTTREQWSLARAIEGYARGGVHGIAIWRDKMKELGLKASLRTLRDHDMTVTGYCVGGLVTARDPSAFRARLEVNRRMIAEAAELSARCIVFVAGGLNEGDKDIDGARERCLEGLAALLPEAKAAGVTLGLEPLHPMLCAARSVLTTLKEANDWCQRLDAGRELGVVVDAYHVWWDPELATQVARAGRRIVAFHVSDWLADTRDLRLDRGMMGDGVIDLPAIRRMVEAAGYEGHREVEIFSARDWWRRDPDEVVRVITERYQTAL